MLWTDLDTPAVIVDAARMQRNLEVMQQRADCEGVVLRPHVKTHKSVTLAKEQRRLGARGLTCAKVSEAAVFIDAGFDDVCIAYPLIGEEKLRRLLDLHSRATVSFCVDSWQGALAASQLFAAHGAQARLLLKVDCGYGRVGLAWNQPELVEIGRAIKDLSGAVLCGVLTHAGQAYHGPRKNEDGSSESREEALERTTCEERDRLLSAAHALVSSGIVGREQPLTISVGSTPTMSRFTNKSLNGLSVTEIRPGNYIFNDLTQVELGVATLDECALTVLSTVISLHRGARDHRGALDVGRKVLTTDLRPLANASSRYGAVVTPEVPRPTPSLPSGSEQTPSLPSGSEQTPSLPSGSEQTPSLPSGSEQAPSLRRLASGIRLHNLSEEHGWLDLDDDAAIEIGQRFEVVPNHSCVVVNTQDRLFLLRDEGEVEVIDVDARGHSQ